MHPEIMRVHTEPGAADAPEGRAQVGSSTGGLKGHPIQAEH